MMPWVLGPLVLPILVVVLLRGLSARRSATFAALGLVFTGLASGAFVYAWLHPVEELWLRVAAALGALAAGQAQLVWVSTLALPRNKVWLRVLAAPLSMMTGACLAFVLMQPAPPAWLVGVTAGLCSLSVVAWGALPWIGRNRGTVGIGSRAVPSVRCACPRCGTQVDWAQGLYACTDCGLFMHLDWSRQPKLRQPLQSVPDPSRTMRFACPGCRHQRDWPRGDQQCPQCGLGISLHWNEHKRPQLPPS